MSSGPSGGGLTTHARGDERVAQRRSGGRVPSGWLTLLAGPMSFGIAGPALVLPDAARDLGLTTPAMTWIVTAFGWAIAVGTPLMAGLQSRRGTRVALAGLVAATALPAD